MDIQHTILLVEDSEDDIFFMKRAMTTAGITNPLQVLEDGEQAISYLSGSGEYQDRERYPLPNLVLLDLKLPYKSGLDVLQWIREHSELETTIVIVLTSSKEDADVDRAYRIGANSYLVKPPSAEKLLELAKALKLYWLNFNAFPAVGRKTAD
jgi:DNA-binding response OmpR family regulator